MKTDDDKKNNKNNKNDKNKKEEDISVKLSMKLLEEVEMKCDSYRGRLVFIVIPASERSVIQHFGKSLGTRDLERIQSFSNSWRSNRWTPAPLDAAHKSTCAKATSRLLSLRPQRAPESTARVVATHNAFLEALASHASQLPT